MAEKLTEIDEIFEYITKQDNFLLSGGAGSGKTYSLVQVIKRIFELRPTVNVACITYTNVAVNQINDRIKFENLRVSTIHDFLWDNIRSFQKNLKEALVELIKSEKISHSGNEILDLDYYSDKSIEYKEWKKLIDGVVSHDEIILLAEYMFEHYPMLSGILIDKYDFILIDEYQDTAPEVVRILLTHLKQAKKKNVIGFFGDSMQSIYPDVVGDIKSFVDANDVKEVIKQDNRRNPLLVVELANKIRTDNVIQKPAADQNAPNHQIQGNIKFLYSNNDNIDEIKKSDHFSTWDFFDTKETKELYLTHNLIAPKAGFPNLMAIYDKERIISFKNDILGRIKDENIQIDIASTFGDVITQLRAVPTGVKAEFIAVNPLLYTEAKQYPFEIFRKIYLDKDQLIGNKRGSEEEELKKGSKRDPIVRHLFHIQDCISFYERGKFNQFIKITGFKVTSIQSKIDLKAAIEKLNGMKENTIEEVIDFAHEARLWMKDDKLNDFIETHKYVYNRVKEVKYKEFCNVYEYVEGFTPFSTQHNIKGAEFDNVFVVLDNGRWNDYNFKYLFTNRTDKETILKRTQKIFYVCCTRAKKNLVVFYHKPDAAVIKQAKEWFGNGNVISI